MIKRDELKTPTSCLNKAAPDEPIFVLRGKDALAAMAVRHWAVMAQGEHEPGKITEALALADQMDEWRKRYLAAIVEPSTPPEERSGIELWPWDTGVPSSRLKIQAEEPTFGRPQEATFVVRGKKGDIVTIREALGGIPAAGCDSIVPKP